MFVSSSSPSADLSALTCSNDNRVRRRAAEQRDERAPLNVNPSGVVQPSMSIGLGFPRLGQRPKSSSASRLTAAQVRVLDLSQSAASPGAAVRVLALEDAFELEQATNRLL
jgi:hypothetical protein